MKKKIIKRLCFLLCVFVFPLLVHADMGVPEIKSYEVIVTNPKGIELDGYGGKVTIPYDTKLEVTSEYYDNADKILVGYVEYNGVYGNINLADTKLYSENVNLKEYSKLDEPEKLYVFRDGAYLYKGPSIMYGKVDEETMIPKGETISYEYYDTVWSYVEYNGVKGWILNYPYFDLYDGLTNAVANIADDNDTVYLAKEVVELDNMPGSKEKVRVTIPKGTELKYKYFYYGIHSKYVFVEYGGISGWLYVETPIGPMEVDASLREKCRSGVIISDETYIYTEQGNIDSKTGNKLPVGAELEVVYMVNSELESLWTYVKYNDEYYWLYEEADTDLYAINYVWYIYTYRTKEKATVYERPDVNSNKIGEIGNKDEVDTYIFYDDIDRNTGEIMYEWYYIKFGDLKGWVLRSVFEEEFLEEIGICSLNGRPNEKPKEIGNPKNNLIQLALYAVCGAVIGSLSGIVTLTLINKKGKKNEEIK